MSEVYEVEDPRLGSRHALKLFTYEKDDPEIRERFLVEGKLLARFSHPRIVHVTDLGLDAESGRPYFVMDLILNERGEMQLLSDVEPGMADEETIGKWYDDLREGLAYIHANGVVHRDLKLQNVLIGPDGHAVLTDFGISKVFDANGDGARIVDTERTLVKIREGRRLVMGSLGYMAPELEMGMAASPQSDWYALGVIVYRLLTGMWCDARTDVIGTLETYDSVWKRIVPKLLHANPNGRECLSYAEEKRAERDKEERAWEEKWLAERARGHRARHWVLYACLFAGVLLFALLVGGGRYCLERENWQRRLMTGGCSVNMPVFVDLFRIPAEAKAEAQCDNHGNVIVPSRNQCEAARLDALVLTYEIFDGVRLGQLTLESAIREMEKLVDRLSDDAAMSPFDCLAVGDGIYMQVGDSQTLVFLFEKAIDRLREIED